jgi:hypothetical protein
MSHPGTLSRQSSLESQAGPIAGIEPYDQLGRAALARALCMPRTISRNYHWSRLQRARLATTRSLVRQVAYEQCRAGNVVRRLPVPPLAAGTRPVVNWY